MDAETQRELQKLGEKINGVCASVETGFAEVRKDIHYLNRSNTPTLILAMAALILSICSMVTALENRNLILSVSVQTSKNTRDLENIFPLVFPGTTPPSESSK